MSTHTSDREPGQGTAPGRYLRAPAARTGLLFAGSLVALSIIAGCGSSGTAGSTAAAPASMVTMPGVSAGGSSGSAAATAAMIHIYNYRFEVPASVGPGERVSVMNMDGEAHTVTADSAGAFDDQATAGAVTTFTAPMKPGSYPFHCAFHANMHGVLIVR